MDSDSHLLEFFSKENTFLWPHIFQRPKHWPAFQHQICVHSGGNASALAQIQHLSERCSNIMAFVEILVA